MPNLKFTVQHSKANTRHYRADRDDGPPSERNLSPAGVWSSGVLRGRLPEAVWEVATLFLRLNEALGVF